MNNFSKLKRIIRISNLPFNDIDILVKFFSKAKDEKLEKINSLLENDPKLIYEINKTVKLKTKK